MKKIVFTGGGSAGHVTPNLAIIPYLKEDNWDISYIGSHQGIEKTIIEKEDIRTIVLRVESYAVILI